MTLPDDHSLLHRRARVGPMASFREMSHNRKLSPITIRKLGGVRRAKASRPYCSSTYASIEATCPEACPFKRNGCMTDAGLTGALARQLDRAAKRTSELGVLAEEAMLIERSFGGKRIPQDGARGGRDLRLHIGGDVRSNAGARLLAAAAWDWGQRGGGSVWTFSHSWRTVDRRSFGAISVLASVEHPRDLRRALARGYAPAIVLPRLPANGRRFRVPWGSMDVIPCPAEVRGTTCVQCRLCLDHDLVGRGVGIAFGVHGPTAGAAEQALVQIRRRA